MSCDRSTARSVEDGSSPRRSHLDAREVAGHSIQKAVGDVQTARSCPVEKTASGLLREWFAREPHEGLKRRRAAAHRPGRHLGGEPLLPHAPCGAWPHGTRLELTIVPRKIGARSTKS